MSISESSDNPRIPDSSADETLGVPAPSSGPITSSDGPQSIDRFKIIRSLGAGGMGDVFLARHPVTGSEVAIKRLKPELVRDRAAVHRFLVEARHMYHLNHPNILRIMEVLDPPAGPYYVMPYMPAGSLANAIRPGQPADYVTTVRVARDVAGALAYAHGKGIIHRDLKPGNVLIDGDGRAYLGDFGLVRTVYNDSVIDVRQNQTMGTASYMSPAVARGEAEDTRCDIYGFGAILYELLAGAAPYGGRSSQEVIVQVIAGPPRPILKLNPHAPAGLVKIAEGCMARELRDRYAKMTDVVEDLDRVEKGKSPRGPHGTEPLRANKAMIGLIAAIVILSIILFGIWLKNRDRSPAIAVNHKQPNPTAVPSGFPVVQIPEVPFAPAIGADEAGHRVFDLLPLINPQRDPLSGKWHRKDGILSVKPENAHMVLRIPILPPDEYNFRVGFTLRQRAAGTHGLVSHGGRFDFMVGNDGYCGLEMTDGANARDRGNSTLIKKPPLTLDVRHEYIIRIRQKFIAVVLDGEEIIGRGTNYSEFTENLKLARPDDAIGLGTWAGGVDFDTVELVEISGKSTLAPRKE